MDDLGVVEAFTPARVHEAIQAAREAQGAWRKSTWEERRHLMRTMLRCLTDNMDAIVRVACRDSGKTKVDAMLGEVLTTCEKLRWLEKSGERWLKPEKRESGLLNLHKTSRVEFHPVGVVGAIVPWNYPFHNVFNPLTAALFAGNAIVIKTSEYASWSTKFYGRLIDLCLQAAGAPRNLVQIVTGYGEAGEALITGGADKIIFVGSVQVGRKVQEACAKTLTPLVLELGGKDPFVICEDASPKAIEQLACRGVYQNMGQNCAGPERFLVYEGVYQEFCDRVSKIVHDMRQGPTLSSDFVDCGAVRLPSHLKHLQDLVDDAVKHGAKLVAGGFIPKKPSRLAEGQFYPPTILSDVTEDMKIMKEEIFGPIMCIVKIKNNSDQEAIRIANNCEFALSSCAFSGSKQRASKLVSSMQAGMGSVNDLEGTTYLSQSLPFGGCKSSGYDRFAGPEGLRGLCHIKSVVEDRFVFHGGPFLAMPAQVTYPSSGQGPGFCKALIKIMYGYSLMDRVKGVMEIIEWSVKRPKNDQELPTASQDREENAKSK
uniref:Aldehyde dehydrogenase n=1 Tax=Guillardia theta TaxID=55529 RepID=A0A7S4NUP9_GUITH